MTAGESGEPAPGRATFDVQPSDSDDPARREAITRRQAVAAAPWPPAASAAPRPATLRAAREDDIFIAAACMPDGVRHALLVLEAGSRLLAGRLAAIDHPTDEPAMPPDVRDALCTVSRWILDLALPGST